MTSIPVAWLISVFALLLVAILARQVRMPVVSRLSFCAGLLSIVVVAVFVGVRFQFSDPAFIGLQPYLAAFTAPALWLGFHTLTTQTGGPGPKTLPVLACILVGTWAVIALPFAWSASVAIILVNAIFAARLVPLLRLPGERFVHIAPQSYGTLRIALLGCLAFLSLVLMIDTSVLITGLAASEARALQLLSDAAVMVVAVISLGVLVVLALAFSTDRESDVPDPAEAGPMEEDRAVYARLERVMAEATLFRDPELTVARLGRRLGVPARAVSSAVNRVTGENTSRYINRLRVEHARHLLESTNLPVTDVMLESGFLSKSSFNTEFRRIAGTTPSEHRKSHRSAPMEEARRPARP